MGHSEGLRHYGRQVFALAAALLCAIPLLALAPGARGEPPAPPNVDTDPGGAPYVAGELLIAYEPGTSGEAEQDVARRSGGRTVEDLPGEVRLVSFPDVQSEQSEETREQELQNELEDLRDDPRVEAADYNYIREATFIPDDRRFGDPGQWGLRKAGFPNAWNDARGTGAKIAIIDSGISQDHPDIGKILAQRDFVSDDSVANDPDGHGTHVAGIAAALTDNGKGVAGGCPACRLLVARVLDASGNTDDATLVAGINWSVNQGADIMNLSLTGPYSETLEAKINNVSAKGVVIVAAAGNEGTTARRYPAAYPAAIAVGATNEKDRLTGFSNRGSWVDLAAPGTDILSARVGQGYREYTGTSQSAPFVSALAGLLASEGKAAGQIRQRMQDTATDLGPAGEDPRYGYGRINAAAAVP